MKMVAAAGVYVRQQQQLSLNWLKFKFLLLFLLRQRRHAIAQLIETRDDYNNMPSNLCHDQVQSVRK